MSDHSTIEWTDATWNPVTGCSVKSPGCKNCYAMKLAGGRLKHHPSRAGLTIPTATGPVWTGEIKINEEWMEQPLAWTRPRMIFVCAHGDLFHEDVPDEVIDRVFAVMALAAQHTFQVLTKRARRMREYFEHPVREALIGQQLGRLQLARTGNPVSEWSGLPLSNVWLGVSAEDQQRADERIPELLAVPASVRFLSLEPLLSDVRLGSWLQCSPSDALLVGRVTADMPAWTRLGGTAIDWVIVGGESGPGARPMHPKWARSLRDECDGAGVAFFFKQWGAWSPGYAEHGNDLAYDVIVNAAQHEWPEGHCSFRVDKSVAGRTLDGRTWDQMPKAEAS